MKIKLFGYLMLIIAVLVASSTPIAYVLGNNISPIQLMLLVSLVGTFASFTAMFATGSQKHLGGILNNRAHLASLVAVGLLLYGIVAFSFAFATHYISASLAAVVYRTWPLMLILLAPLVLRERIRVWDWIAVGLGFFALAFVLLVNTSLSLPAIVIPFVAVMLIAAFSDAVASAIQKRYHYEIYSSIFVYNLSALFVFTILAFLFGGLSIPSLSLADIGAVFFLGIMQNVVLTITFLSALRTLKTAVVGNATNISPFITMVLGAAFLGEAIQPSYVIIALGVVLGLIVQKLAPRGSNYISEIKSGSALKSLPVIYDVTSAFVNTKNTKVYDVMKGNGRILAYYLDPAPDSAVYKRYIDSENMKADGSILMTNRTNSAELDPNEMEFIKEIMGHDDEALVVLGAGEPGLVERKFSDMSASLS